MKAFLNPTQMEPYRLLTDIQDGLWSFLVSVKGSREDLTALPWEILPSPTPDEVIFRFQTSDGLEIRKRFSIGREEGDTPFTFRLRVSVKNIGEKNVDLTTYLSGPAGIPIERLDYPNLLAYVASGVNPKEPTVEEIDLSDVEEGSRKITPHQCHYAGVGNKYFGAVLIPKDPTRVADVAVRSLLDTALWEDALRKTKDPAKARKKTVRNLQPILSLKDTEEGPLAPGKERTWEFTVFAGPKRDPLLEALSLKGIRTSISSFCFPSSWTRGLSWVMLKILIFFNGIVSNFGVAILLLTVLVRALMFPLSIRMQISMNEYQKKMKKIQPKMQEIKERYKDKQRQQQELTKLMREHGVSLLPLKGCLPIFLQFPIFIALFVTLRNSLELRHAGFLYIRDLALPDQLFPFPEFVPDMFLIGGILGSHFNLLPILWIALMILQQRLTPQPATDDPQMKSQRKMMLIMSIAFGVLFFRIEAGCALYIITSTLWGMGESTLIRRRLAAQEQA
ncbi:MAG: YidC/Oxa1 family insertase periplasmic-domain containing protein [Planctomycetota bacterium]